MLHSFKLTLPSSYTGKPPVTPLAEPPTPDKDAPNKTEQLGELLGWSVFLHPCPRSLRPSSSYILRCTGVPVIQLPGKASWAQGAKLMQESAHQRERRGSPNRLKPGHPANPGSALSALLSLYLSTALYFPAFSPFPRAQPLPWKLSATNEVILRAGGSGKEEGGLSESL